MNKIANIPSNLVMGFLGAGKTTAILDLLKQKPKNENWAVLVNEFGKVGIDGALYKTAGVTVKEIAGGCLCCAVGLPFKVSINRLLKAVRPDRLLIEPTGLGHPKKVLDILVRDTFEGVLDCRASICLVDPEKLKDRRYTTHENFIDQIALSDVLVANKMDLANREAVELFHQWADNSRPRKARIAQTVQGQLDIAWLDLPLNAQRQAAFPNAHELTEISPTDSAHLPFSNTADGYQSFGAVFPVQSCFDFVQLTHLLKQLNAERIKGMVFTNKGWFIINGAGGIINAIPTPPAVNSRIAIITQQNSLPDIATLLNPCRIDNAGHYNLQEPIG